MPCVAVATDRVQRLLYRCSMREEPGSPADKFATRRSEAAVTEWETGSGFGRYLLFHTQDDQVATGAPTAMDRVLFGTGAGDRLLAR